MNNAKFFQMPLRLVLIVLLLFSGACNKDLPLKLSDDDNNARALSGNKVSSSREKAVRKTFRKITVQGTGTSKPSKPLDEAKLNAAFKERQMQKKNIKGFRIASGTFTANDMGPYYSCHVESQNGGTIDYYLVETYSGTWTSIGENSLGYIDFYVDKPYVYEQFLVWSPQEGFTNALDFGDPYVGVSLVNGILEFTDASALDVILDRLEQAQEHHSSNFIDPLDYMSDDALTDYAESVAFDEFLPMKEFEAFFGLYSLRQMIETEEIAWLNTEDPWAASVYPDDKYAIEDDAERTINNQYGQVKVSGILIEPVSLIEVPNEEVFSCNVENFSCFEKHTITDTQDLPNNKKIHWKVTKKKGAGESGGEIWFKSYFKGKIRRFRKVGVFWSKHMARMSVQIIGNARYWNGSNSCTAVLESFNKTKPLKRKYMRDEKDKWDTYTTIRSCDAQAIFTVDGTSFTKFLR